MSKILEPGKAFFKIDFVYDTDKDGGKLVSKASGNPMVKVKIVVTDSKQESENIWDYIVTNNPRKMISLLESIGKPEWIEPFKSGNFDALDLTGEEGKCIIKTSEETPEYPAKTVISWYIKKSAYTKDGSLSKETDKFKFIQNKVEEIKKEYEDIPF